MIKITSLSHLNKKALSPGIEPGQPGMAISLGIEPRIFLLSWDALPLGHKIKWACYQLH